MSGFGGTFRNDLLLLIFNATNIANIADNAASSPLTNLQVALHSAYVDSSGNQTTNEVSYGSYARVAVARTNGGWTVSGNLVVPVSTIAFPAASSGSATAMFATIGTASSSTGKVLARAGIGGAPQIVHAATSDTITATAHGLAVSDRVAFYPTHNVSLPTGITEGTVYFVKTAPDANTLTISATDGGSTIDVTGAAGCIMQRITPLIITSSPQVTPQLTTSTSFRVL